MDQLLGLRGLGQTVFGKHVQGIRCKRDRLFESSILDLVKLVQNLHARFKIYLTIFQLLSGHVHRGWGRPGRTADHLCRDLVLKEQEFSGS